MGLRPSDKIPAVAEGPPAAHPTATSARFVKPKHSAGQLNYNIVSLPIENSGLLADRFLRLASGGLAATMMAVRVKRFIRWVISYTR